MAVILDEGLVQASPQTLYCVRQAHTQTDWALHLSEGLQPRTDHSFALTCEIDFLQRHHGFLQQVNTLR